MLVIIYRRNDTISLFAIRRKACKIGNNLNFEFVDICHKKIQYEQHSAALPIYLLLYLYLLPIYLIFYQRKVKFLIPFLFSFWKNEIFYYYTEVCQVYYSNILTCILHMCLIKVWGVNNGPSQQLIPPAGNILQERIRTIIKYTLCVGFLHFAIIRSLYWWWKRFPLFTVPYDVTFPWPSFSFLIFSFLNFLVAHWESSAKKRPIISKWHIHFLTQCEKPMHYFTLPYNCLGRWYLK
jgi:hypothetical protein